MSKAKAVALLAMEPKYRIFTEAILTGAGPTAAARLAGSENPSSDGPRWLKLEEVRSLIVSHEEDTREKISITRKDVVEGFRQAISVAETAGEQIAGWREIGKMLGFYEPEKVEHVVRPESATERELRTMSDADLARALGRPELQVIEAQFREVNPPQEDDPNE